MKLLRALLKFHMLCKLLQKAHKFLISNKFINIRLLDRPLADLLPRGMLLLDLCQTGLNNLCPEGYGTSDQGCNEARGCNTSEGLVLGCPYFGFEDLAGDTS